MTIEVPICFTTIKYIFREKPLSLFRELSCHGDSVLVSLPLSLSQYCDTRLNKGVGKSLSHLSLTSYYHFPTSALEVKF